MEEIYICSMCKHEFKESELHEISTQEYPGAKIWKESVSPCCNYFYTDKD